MRKLLIALGALLALAAPLAVAPGPAAAADEVRPIFFPVEGLVRYSNDFGAPRGGGTRTHEGNDIVGKKLQRLLSTVNGRVTFLRLDMSGNSGNVLAITDADGWEYWYVHINNDSPGTDDGLNPLQWAVVPGLKLGSRVMAGQHIAYLGDSGNAEGTVPHLHFEIQRPDGTPINPYFSLQGARRGPASTGRAVAAHPDGGYYVLTADGEIHAFDGAPLFGSPRYGWDIARGMAVMPDGEGYIVLDGWGGVAKFGSAAVGDMAAIKAPWWKGWDITRGLAITPSGRGVVVLDGWGGVTSLGDAPKFTTPWWRGWDIARSISLTPSGKGGYVLDGWGGVHPTGDAVRLGSPWWPNWDIARSVVASEAGYAVLDGFGGLRTYGDAPKPTGGTWEQADRWRSLVSDGDGGYLAVRNDAFSERR